MECLICTKDVLRVDREKGGSARSSTGVFDVVGINTSLELFFTASG